MKRILLILAVGIAILSILCVGLALGIAVTPVRAQVGRAIGRVIDQVGSSLQIEPEVQARSAESGAHQSDDEAQANETQAEREPGILVAGVVQDSPAEKAGLRRGDILLAVDGEEVNQLHELQEKLQTYQAGDVVELLVQRGDAQVTLKAALENSTGEAPAVYLGVYPCSCLNQETGPRIFRYRMGEGVIIREVIPDSPADEAGLEPGQVITAINGQSLGRATGLNQALADYAPGDQVELTVKDADGEPQQATVTLGENPARPGAAWLGLRFGPPIQLDPEWRMPWMPDGSGEPLPEMPRRWFDTFPDHLPPDLETMRPGAVITQVIAGSPAEEAGLKTGQIILAVDGEELDGQDKLVDIIAGHEPGDTVTLMVFDPGTEGEQAREVEATLGENPEQEGSAWLGIRFGFLDIEQIETPELPTE